MVMPSSLCQLPRSSPWCFKSSSARRPAGYTLRLTHACKGPETRMRRLMTHAQAEDRPSSVADQSITIGPFKAKEVTEADWESEVLNSPVPVFVDFWAPWCGPCKMIGPTIDEIIDELGDKFKCVKLNTDKSPGVATEYGIRSIPTCMIFKDGKKVDTIIGAVKKQILKSSIEKYLP